MANYIEIKPATFNGPLPIPMSIVNNDPNGFIVSGHQIHWGGSKFNGTTVNTTNDLFNAIFNYINDKSTNTNVDLTKYATIAQYNELKEQYEILEAKCGWNV